MEIELFRLCFTEKLCGKPQVLAPMTVTNTVSVLELSKKALGVCGPAGPMQLDHEGGQDAVL